ncbi:hypothetical protein IW150_000438 [Coemansia sp. RSA 2607]|nr:hypothetical protein IW150_000438 [Coemansia sp. RSA 2607]
MQPESKSKKYAAVESYDDDEEYFDSEDEDDPRSKNYHKNIVYGYSKKSRSNWYRRNNYKSRK